MKGNRQRGLMSEGSISKVILLFFIPLLLGNVFQLLYSTIDAYVVGKYVGVLAFAAVGSSSAVINLILGFFLGLSAGSSVIVARYFGARRHRELSQAVHTMVCFLGLMGIGVTFIGVVLTPLILTMMNTPQNVFGLASMFLRINFMGSIFLLLYDAGAGILQATGDTRRPLFYLALSCVAKFLLNLLFVRVFHWGLAGVGAATLIAQFSSAAAVMITLFLTKKPYKLRVTQLRMHPQMLKEIVRIGIPTGLQQVIVSFSNLMVQGYVNRFGADVMAGYAAAGNVNNFLGLPAGSLGIAITTFTSQNLGANRPDRVKRGVYITNLLGILIMVLIAIPCMVFSHELIAFFSADPTVIEIGSHMIRVITLFYIPFCMGTVMAGALRGSGNSRTPMFILIFCFTIIRQIFLFAAMPLFNSIDVVYWGYNLTWTISAILFEWVYRRHMVKRL